MASPATLRTLADTRTWPAARRRTAIVTFLGLALIGIASAATLWFLSPGLFGTLGWALIGVSLFLLAAAGGIKLTAPAGPRPQADAARGGATPAAPVAPEPAAPMAPEAPMPLGEILMLRCGECQTVFDLPDTGVRPLYHHCPGCGAEGVVRGEGFSLMDARQPWAEPPAPAATPEPAPVAPAAPLSHQDLDDHPFVQAMRDRIKIRCAACKGVFLVQDNEPRPRVIPCAYCAQPGLLK